MAPTVGVVVSNYNGWQDTLKCLASLEQQTFQNFEIILLDDASTNDSVEHLQRALDARCIFLPQQNNLGFAAANNLGMRRALADGVSWVMLLNSDTVCDPCLLQNLLDNTRPGAVSGPKMLFLNESEKLWFAGGEMNGETFEIVHFGGGKQDAPRYSIPKQVGFLTFCCVLIPRGVIEQIGYLNEELFMYCEDAEYCARLKAAGIALWYLPQAKLWHGAGGTAGGMLSVYYITRNTLYLRCHGLPPRQRRHIAAAALAQATAQYIAARLCGRAKGRSYGHYLGAHDFAAGKMGRIESRCPR